jgi:hypothetical protein
MLCQLDAPHALAERPRNHEIRTIGSCDVSYLAGVLPVMVTAEPDLRSELTRR